MTKTVSLADDAYESLLAVKRPDESFSELARRLARTAALQDLFDPAMRDAGMTDEEADQEKTRIYQARDESLRPRHGSE